MKKKVKKIPLCARCGNELPWIKTKDHIFCPWCHQKNMKSEIVFEKKR